MKGIWLLGMRWMWKFLANSSRFTCGPQVREQSYWNMYDLLLNPGIDHSPTPWWSWLRWPWSHVWRSVEQHNITLIIHNPEIWECVFNVHHHGDRVELPVVSPVQLVTLKKVAISNHCRWYLVSEGSVHSYFLYQFRSSCVNVLDVSIWYILCRIVRLPFI